MAKNNDMDTPEKSDFNEVLARMAFIMEHLATKPEQSTTSMELMTRLTEALEKVSVTQMEGAKLQAAEIRRAHRPSNEVTPGVSVFNRRGDLLPDYKKPQLKCLMMIPWLVEWESCTREEVELLNLLEAGDYLLKRTDNSKIRVSVQITYKPDNETPSHLVMNHETAFNNDNFRLVPPFNQMLRQLLKQHEPEIAIRAAGIMSDDEEAELIEKGELSVSR